MEKNIPIEELLHENEGAALDFKREQYKFVGASDYEKCELLKDVLAFANAWRRVDAYILIGVQDKRGGRGEIIGIDDQIDDAQIQQFINQKTQKPIEFEYRTVMVDGKKIGVIRIPVQTRPFFLQKDFGNLKKNVAYIRRGSSTDDADPDEIKEMALAENQDAQEIPALSFEFANLENRQLFGVELSLEATILAVPSAKQIPDYQDEVSQGDQMFRRLSYQMNSARSSYYRELVNYYYIKFKSSELSFGLKNDSTKSIADIRVEIIVNKLDNKFDFFYSNRLPALPASHTNPLDIIRTENNRGIAPIKRYVEIQDVGDSYRIEVVFEKAQPKQTVFCPATIYIVTNESFSIEAQVTIYADNIPVPIQQVLKIDCLATKRDGSLERIKEIHKEYLLENYLQWKGQ